MKKTALAMSFLLSLALLGLMSCTQSAFRESELNVITGSLSTQQDIETPKIADENQLPQENAATSTASNVSTDDPEETASPNDLSLSDSPIRPEANLTGAPTPQSDAHPRPPDGRIYFGSDEPIGYIPTNYPKEWMNIPLIPPAL